MIAGSKVSQSRLFSAVRVCLSGLVLMVVPILLLGGFLQWGQSLIPLYIAECAEGIIAFFLVPLGWWSRAWSALIAGLLINGIVFGLSAQLEPPPSYIAQRLASVRLQPLGSVQSSGQGFSGDASKAMQVTSDTSTVVDAAFRRAGWNRIADSNSQMRWCKTDRFGWDLVAFLPQSAPMTQVQLYVYAFHAGCSV